MNNKSLFTACTTQCVWCMDQWPLVDGVHVAPFTRDPKLYSHPCAAESIRKGFDYWSFKGGKQKKWTPPSARSLLESLDANGRGKKLSKNLSSPSNRSFWRNAICCSIEVNSWPEWKRSYSISGQPVKKLTEAERAKEDADDREKLLFYDAMDYWTRQACTDNHQFRPGYDKGYMKRPDCNYGFGCTTCWAKYEAFDKEEEKHRIDI